MKQLFLLAIVFTLCTNSYSQKILFTDTSNIRTFRVNNPPEALLPYYYSVRQLPSNKTIDDKIYSGSETAAFGVWYYQDTTENKVYVRYESTIHGTAEYTIYDFDMNEGDSLLLPTTIGASDTLYHVCTAVFPDVLIDGVAHRYFAISAYNFDGGVCGYQVIEGIGTLGEDPLNACVEWPSDLVCFENKGRKPIFSDYFNNSCSFLSDNKLVLAEDKLAIFPSPCIDVLNVSLTNSMFIGSRKYQVFNSIGQTLLRGSLLDNNAIDISVLPSGYYFLSITTDKGSSYYQKFSKL